ncbi:adenylosuccinate synthetase [Ideonella sp. A 288]|uniref:adenylosuccinate synthetase n=1 Tax=Ideonella sp. A 288 TaxID=1962181 RepID=UPI000B4B55EE|nr:adenylosuccinate synthetase [Ideonella sp. A 288]
MKPRAIVLSGRGCAGKSTLAATLVARAGATLVRSKDLIIDRLPRTTRTSMAMRRAGERLDRETGGRWLAQALDKKLMNEASPALVVVDPIATPDQVRFLRQSGWSVTHVHLKASQEELARRLSTRLTNSNKSTSGEPAEDWGDKHVDVLERLADVVIDTDRCSESDVFARVVARIEVRPVTAFPIIDVLVGGQYGSEGKGNIAHYLAPEYDVLVRVGGPNAGHKVYRPGEDPYTFRQLPSGALGNRDAILVVGAGAVISLDTLLREIGDLAIPYDKLVIDPQAMIIDKAIDISWEEEHLKGQIGSTAQGIGSATARKILYRDPAKNVRLAGAVPELRHYIQDTIEFFAGCLSTGKKIMLEGTQGTSLSLHHGHYPHVTSRATTATACLAEAGLSARHVRRVVMVCRTYPIRVGVSITGNTSGFMSQEIQFKDIADRSGISLEELTKNEVGSVSNRPRRVAEFDWAQLRRSLLLNGPTDIFLTFADYFGVENREAYRYEQLNATTLRFIEEVEKVCGVPVSMISTAFNDRNIIDRRMW